MSKQLRAATLKLVCVLSFITCHAQRHPAVGTYSRHPVAIWDQIAGSPKPMRIESPDRLTHLTIRYSEIKGEGAVSIVVAGRMGKGFIDLGLGVGSELTWRPDSLAFFVTTSDQGANGEYRVVLVRTEQNTVRSQDLSQLIRSEFGHPVHCGWLEDPNVGGVAWTANGNVLVAAEVISHSNCDSFGTFTLYDVNPSTMRIVRSYNQLEAKHLFRKELGRELLDAPDRCIRKPSACFVAANHPARPLTK